MTVFIGKPLDNDKRRNSVKLTVINQLIEENDIKDLKSLLFMLKWVNNASMGCLFEYDNLSCDTCINCGFNDCDNQYNSDLEYTLTDLNKVGYPIGYTIEVIIGVLAKRHNINKLIGLKDDMLLDMLNLNDIGCYDAIIRMLEPLFSDIFSLKYIELSLYSFIKEVDKVNFLIEVLEGKNIKLDAYLEGLNYF